MYYRIERISYFVPMVLWLLIMLYLSHQNGTDTWNTSHGMTVYLSSLLGIDPQWLHSIVRKLAHLVLYFVLELFTVFAAVKSGVKYPLKWTFLPIAVSLLDEGTKPLVPGRHCDAEDILLNDLGVVIGCIVIWYMTRKSVDKRMLG